MTTNKLLLILLTFISIFTYNSAVNAQETLKDANQVKETRPFQFSFVYPLGTNGTNSGNYSNHASINILGGYNGGVGAFEVGAFANINNGQVNGFQAAGFANVNLAKTNGFQGAGFYNQSYEFNGGQFAGFANVNMKKSIGFMGAGFANVTLDQMDGWQVAGFANVSTKSTNGAQLSGYANFSKDSLTGAQISGFANVAKTVTGAQISGFVNVARKVKGVQIGVFNVADSVDGVPIGFLSFVKNGYRRVEFGASESLFANVSFKTGVNQFYNIFTVGFKQLNEDTYWSYGYGVGTMFALNKKMNINLDAVAQQINENQWHTNKVNILSTLKLNASYKFTERLELVVGPSFNVMVSEYDFREGIGTKSTFVPWAFYDKVHGDYSVKMFAGFNAAIRF